MAKSNIHSYLLQLHKVELIVVTGFTVPRYFAIQLDAASVNSANHWDQKWYKSAEST